MSESAEEGPLSSDDPTTVCAPTTSSYLREPPKEGFLKKSGSSSHGSGNVFQRSPTASTSGTVVWRSKKRSAFVKQRPKSFTENLSSHANSGFGQALSPIADLVGQKSSFVSDTALNFIGNNSGSWSSSGGGSPAQSTTDALKEKKKSKFRRRLLRHRKRSSIDFDEDDVDCLKSSLFGKINKKQRLHFTFAIYIYDDEQLFNKYDFSVAGGFQDMENQLEEIENTIPDAPLKKPNFLRLNSDNTSVNTEELHTNDQDWDSYQVSRFSLFLEKNCGFLKRVYVF